VVLPTRTEVHASTGPSSSSSVRSVTLCQIPLLLLRFRSSLVHSHHLPRRRIHLVQLRRFRNQLLHSRPLHILEAPQLDVTHALPLALKQFLGTRKHRSSPEPKRSMLLLHKVDAQRPVRIKRGRLPWTHIPPAARRCLLHQRTRRLRHACKLARLLYVSI